MTVISNPVDPHALFQAGSALLAAAMRDPNPLIDLSTFWDFMKVVEDAAALLTQAEKGTGFYRQYLACYARIVALRDDATMVGGDDQKWVQLGSRLVEAMAAYAAQAPALLCYLLDHRPAAHTAPFTWRFAQVMEALVRDITEAEVPHEQEVAHVLCQFRAVSEKQNEHR